MTDELTSLLQDNLTAIELFPKEWIREVGDRIRLPVKPDADQLALAWHNAGLSKKQVRKLLRDRNGSLIPYYYIDKMIDRARTFNDYRINITS